MAKSPEKTKPADPLAHVREEMPRMPALTPPKKPTIGDNSGRLHAVEILNSAIQRLGKLDLDIAALNRGKSDIYAELKAQGFDNGIVRRVIKERKLDPLVRADREKLFEAYWQAVDTASASQEGEKAA
jgi:uncharacterized protein (UPF0335 family)